MIGTRHRFVLIIGDEGATLCEVKGAIMLGFEAAVAGDDSYCDTVHGIAFASRNRP